MKKVWSIVLTSLLVLGLCGCSKSDESKILKVSATIDPHAKILEEAKPILKEKYGIELEVTVLDDYYIFNRALDAGEVDANYFQHVPYFENEVATKGYQISNVAGIHIEPFGFYSNTIKDISELKDNATVVISNSVADHGRILKILENAGLIKLRADATALDATVADIEENYKNLKFIEVKPELLSLSLENNEGDLVAINGNYAIAANLNPTKDAVILEQADENNPYVNIIAVRKGHENDEKIKALVEVLKSEEIKNFILETYNDGSVIPAN